MKRFVLAAIMLLFSAIAWATPPAATIVYQPMTSEGLAAGYPFEAWVYFDRSPDPAVPGYAFPAGATFRFKFPQAFTPQSTHNPQAVLLSGSAPGRNHGPFHHRPRPSGSPYDCAQAYRAPSFRSSRASGAEGDPLALGSPQSLAAGRLSHRHRILRGRRTVRFNSGDGPHYRQACSQYRRL